MTNQEKYELSQLAKEGLSFDEIKGITDCSDDTIRRYIKIFNPQSKNNLHSRFTECPICGKDVYVVNKKHKCTCGEIINE